MAQIIPGCADDWGLTAKKYPLCVLARNIWRIIEQFKGEQYEHLRGELIV